MHAMIAKWAPAHERTRMAAAIYSGSQAGTIVANFATGIICAELVWEWSFYLFGIGGLVWCALWILLVTDTPASHPTITEWEKAHIAGTLVDGAAVAPVSSQLSKWRNIPTRAILRSPAVWALVVAHTCQNYGFYTLITELPTFLRQVLHFDLSENGMVTSLPYVANIAVIVFAANFADLAQSRGWLSTTGARKLCNSLGFFGPAVMLVVVCFCGCNSVATVTVLCLVQGLNGFSAGGYNVNHVDLSPRFAGVLMGITNMVANTMGYVAPFVTGRIIQGHVSL